jgi:hypothetical protein
LRFKDLEAGIPPTPEHMAEMGKLIGEMVQSGALLATDGLQASSKGARVKLADGKLAVTDGPFTETKELIAGYGIPIGVQGGGHSIVRALPEGSRRR